MADPIIPDHYRCQVVFKGRSGLATDVYVNSWVFRNDGLANASIMADTVTTMLEAFYNGTAANGSKVLNFFSDDSVVAVDYRQYDLGQTPPRLPTVRENFFTIGALPGDPVPQEVACCLSFESEKRGPRGRGRLYLGPLNTTALQMTGNQIHVASTFRAAIADRALDLVNSTENATWCLLSHADQDTSRVVGGYVDDTFDIQRRRGPDTIDRVLWGSYRGVNYETPTAPQ